MYVVGLKGRVLLPVPQPAPAPRVDAVQAGPGSGRGITPAACPRTSATGPVGHLDEMYVVGTRRPDPSSKSAPRPCAWCRWAWSGGEDQGHPDVPLYEFVPDADSGDRGCCRGTSARASPTSSCCRRRALEPRLPRSVRPKTATDNAQTQIDRFTGFRRTPPPGGDHPASGDHRRRRRLMLGIRPHRTLRHPPTHCGRPRPSVGSTWREHMTTTTDSQAPVASAPTATRRVARHRRRRRHRSSPREHPRPITNALTIQIEDTGGSGLEAST